MNKSRTSDSIEDFSDTLTNIELVLIGSVMVIICAITIIGNALVLISFAMDKKLRTLSNYFLLSLAVSDIMIATFSMPLYIAYLLIGEWTLGPTVCDMWLSQDYTCSNASGLNLLMISFDRYFSVTSPLKYRARRTGKRVAFMISFVWIASFIIWPPWIYAWPYIEGRRTVPDDDCYVQFLETNSYLTIITAVIDYYIPILIMFVLYYRVWRETKKRSKYLADMETGYQTESMCLQKLSPHDNLKLKTTHSEDSKRDNHQDNLKAVNDDDKDSEAALLKNTAVSQEISIHESDAENGDASLCGSNDVQKSSGFSSTPEDISVSPSENGESKMMSPTRKGNIKQDKAAKVLTSILLAFVITTTPYNVLAIIKNLDRTHSLVPDAVWNFCYYLFYVNSTLNPLCYALANENFRKTYWQILTCSWSKRSQYSSSNYSNTSSQSKDIHMYNVRYVTSSL